MNLLTLLNFFKFSFLKIPFRDQNFLRKGTFFKKTKTFYDGGMLQTNCCLSPPLLLIIKDNNPAPTPESSTKILNGTESMSTLRIFRTSTYPCHPPCCLLRASVIKMSFVATEITNSNLYDLVHKSYKTCLYLNSVTLLILRQLEIDTNHQIRLSV